MRAELKVGGYVIRDNPANPQHSALVTYVTQVDLKGGWGSKQRRWGSKCRGWGRGLGGGAAGTGGGAAGTGGGAAGTGGGTAGTGGGTAGTGGGAANNRVEWPEVQYLSLPPDISVV